MAISQVVAMTVDGVLYNTIPPNASGSDAGGTGGSAAKISNSSLLDGVSVAKYDAGVFGSTVVSGVNSTPATMAPFATINAHPIAKKLPWKDTTILSSGASVPSLVESIHYIKVCGEGCTDGIRTRKLTSAIRSGKYNEFNGQFEAGYPENQVDVFASDDAAKPTRSVPGELTYKSSSLVPVNDSYKAKTG